MVHGIKRCSSSFNTGRVDHLYQDPHAPPVISAGLKFLLLIVIHATTPDAVVY